MDLVSVTPEHTREGGGASEEVFPSATESHLFQSRNHKHVISNNSIESILLGLILAFFKSRYVNVDHGVLCLQVWRGTLARMRYRRMRAALVILRAYRRYKVKSYIREVNRRFRNVRSMKDYGRQVKWPTPPKVLRRFEEALRSIYSRYPVDNLVRFYPRI